MSQHVRRIAITVAVLVTVVLLFSLLRFVPAVAEYMNRNLVLSALVMLALYVAVAFGSIIALTWNIPFAVFGMFQGKIPKTLPQCAVVGAGVVALVLVGIWVAKASTLVAPLRAMFAAFLGLKV